MPKETTTELLEEKPAKRNKGGRPTKYKEEFIDKAYEYIQACADEEYQLTKSFSDKGESWDNKIRVKLPTIGGFALFIGVSERVLYDWGNENDDFLQALNDIKEEQKRKLLDNGLSGHYNSTIAKLILSSNHGMAEKREDKVDHTTDGKPVTGFMYVKPE